MDKWKIPIECKTCKWRKDLYSRASQHGDWENTACCYTLLTDRFRPESDRKYGEPMKERCSAYAPRKNGRETL